MHQEHAPGSCTPNFGLNFGADSSCTCGGCSRRHKSSMLQGPVDTLVPCNEWTDGAF